MTLLSKVVRPSTVSSVFCLVLAGCSGDVSHSGANALDELFQRGAPIQISDSVVWALTSRVSEEDAERLGPRVGHIPLSILRGQTEDGSHFPAGEYAITTVSGEHLAYALSPVPRIILDTPYWPSIFRRLGARSRTGGYNATNLLYKIYRYGGEGRLLDSIWVPPPAWKQAKQPAMGDFLPGRPEEWSTYLDSISVIRALAVVGDSVLVVSVGPYEGGGASYSLDPGGFLEVYIGDRIVGTDLRTPGGLVAYSKKSLFFLVRSAHPNGAILTEYTWHGGER